MGYSIGIRARNDKLAKKMLSFMGENYRKWSVVLGQGESISSGSPTGDMSYDHGKLALGFDYASHCHGWESCLIYSETRWMAVKIGKRKTRFSKKVTLTTNVFDKPVPFMVYDGYESWPIIVVEDLAEAMRLPKGNRWCATDSLGVYIGPEVNTILTHYSEAWYSDVKLSERMDADLRALGERPKDEEAFKIWRERHEAVRVKHLRPDIDVNLKIVREEVARLDALWEKTS